MMEMIQGNNTEKSGQFLKEFCLFHLAPFIIICVHIFLKPWTGDESFHLHNAYLIGLGLKPYTDFFIGGFPPLWYVFSPIAFFGSFSAKIAFSKAIQCLVFGLSLSSLAYSFPSLGKWRSWAMILFFLMTSAYVDHLDLRPEYIAIPFAVLATGIIIRNDALNARMAVIMGILCAAHVFFTPRVYPIILVTGLVLLIRPASVRIKSTFIISGLITAMMILLALNLKDILFFIFGMQKSRPSLPFGKLFYNTFFLYGALTFLSISMILQAVFFRREGWIMLCLNLLLIGSWLMEKAPYPAQSTLFILLVNFMYAFDVFTKLIKSGYFRTLILTGFAGLVLLVVWKRNIYKRDNYFEKADFFEKKLADCAGKTFFGTNASIIYPGKEDRVHPIFIRDYSYFGSYYKDFMEHQIANTIEHNKGKNIKYFSDSPPCYIDKEIATVMQKHFPQLTIPGAE